MGAKMEIYALMDRLATEGKAIIMISSELPEIIGMTDRMYIMRDGKIAGELKHEDYSQETIGAMMMID